jgi:hypothetical protein
VTDRLASDCGGRKPPAGGPAVAAPDLTCLPKRRDSRAFVASLVTRRRVPDDPDPHHPGGSGLGNGPFGLGWPPGRFLQSRDKRTSTSANVSDFEELRGLRA